MSLGRPNASEEGHMRPHADEASCLVRTPGSDLPFAYLTGDTTEAAAQQSCLLILSTYLLFSRVVSLG